MKLTGRPGGPGGPRGPWEPPIPLKEKKKSKLTTDDDTFIVHPADEPSCNCCLNHSTLHFCILYIIKIKATSFWPRLTDSPFPPPKPWGPGRPLSPFSPASPGGPIRPIRPGWPWEWRREIMRHKHHPSNCGHWDLFYTNCPLDKRRFLPPRLFTFKQKRNTLANSPKTGWPGTSLISANR